jgi:hypothetical protein
MNFKSRAVAEAVAEIEHPPPAFTDDALALRFAERHAGSLRYVATLGKWSLWDGQRWQIDETLMARHHAREVCRAASAECNQAKIAKLIASAKTISAAERLAQADRRIAATVDEWDVAPLIFGPGNSGRTVRKIASQRLLALRRILRVPRLYGMRFSLGSPTIRPNSSSTCAEWPVIRSLGQHKSTRCFFSMDLAQTARPHSLMRLPAVPAIIIGRPYRDLHCLIARSTPHGTGGLTWRAHCHCHRDRGRKTLGRITDQIAYRRR